MKLYVANISSHGDRVYVEGVRHVRVGDKFESRVVNTSFKADVFKDKFKNSPNMKSFPIIIDISFRKGIGAVFNE